MPALATSAFAAFALAAGCASESDISRLEYEDSFFQEGTDRVDILWIVDNSNSMANEQIKVAEGFHEFIQAVGVKEEVDFHLGLVSTDMDLANAERGLLIGDPPYLTREDSYAASFMDRVRVGTIGSDKERGLQAALHALTDPAALEHNTDFLREDAVLALVFVSDENDCSDDNWLADDQEGSLCYEIDEKLVPTAEFVRAFQAIKGLEGRVVASSIVGPPVSEGCDASWPGQRYWTVAEELGGLVADICESDYLQIMDDVGSRISEPQRAFFLTHSPVEESIVVLVDDVELAPDPVQGWTFDGALDSINFTGDYVPAFGSVIRVGYDIGGD